jgi:hypothetical protein
VNGVYLMEDWRTSIKGSITVDAIGCWEVCQVFSSCKGNDALLLLNYDNQQPTFFTHHSIYGLRESSTERNPLSMSWNYHQRLLFPLYTVYMAQSIDDRSTNSIPGQRGHHNIMVIPWHTERIAFCAALSKSINTVVGEKGRLLVIIVLWTRLKNLV